MQELRPPEGTTDPVSPPHIILLHPLRDFCVTYFLFLFVFFPFEELNIYKHIFINPLLVQLYYVIP